MFFGSSHPLTAIFPMQLWHDYGIISYNLGNHSETMITTYYNMLLALKYKSPKLIVIDAYKIASINKIDNENNKELVHNSFDIYPVSYTKYLAIKDIYDNKEILNNEIEYLFPFSMYHARWDEINSSDFRNISTNEKGAELKTEVTAPNKMSNINEIAPYSDEENVNMQYLKKFIEHCKDNNIQVLVTYLPYPAKDNLIAMSKYVQKVCDEYNVNYINFLEKDVVNYNTDCHDSNSHLNASGARKVTDYLGKYIMENYDIEDQRKNEDYSFWYDDYNKYIDKKISILNNNKNKLNSYLMLLYDEKDIGYEITVSSKKEIIDGSVFKQLLENLNNNYEINDEVFKEKTDKQIKIKTWDNRTGKEIQTVWF